MHYVYILRSESDAAKIYIGSSADLKKRLTDHNRGICQSTQSGIPWTLEWYGAFRSKTRALEFERYLKSGSGFAFRKKRLTD